VGEAVSQTGEQDSDGVGLHQPRGEERRPTPWSGRRVKGGEALAEPLTRPAAPARERSDRLWQHRAPIACVICRSMRRALSRGRCGSPSVTTVAVLRGERVRNRPRYQPGCKTLSHPRLVAPKSCGRSRSREKGPISGRRAQSAEDGEPLVALQRKRGDGECLSAGTSGIFLTGLAALPKNRLLANGGPALGASDRSER